MPSVFDLRGRGEVDLTAALGWTLTHSPNLRAALWERLSLPGTPDDARVDLEVADDLGRTDLELATDDATVVFEAKKGWLLPGETQLAKYVPRLTGMPHPLLVSLSDSSAAWAALELGTETAGIPIRHLPWDAIRADVRQARKHSRAAERHWLDQLAVYLAGATAVREPSEQWAYCVVLSTDTMGGPRTFRQYVQDERVYFHPYGGANTWPKRPPTFLCFRWGGRVQQVNRVNSSEVVATLQDAYPDIPPGGDTADPHMVYTLGPDLPLGPNPIPTKGVYANARVWALVDQILTCGGLAKAVSESKRLTQPVAD